MQTDPFLDRAPDPVYIPAKTGVDAETQIQDGELFDFDLESKPILEVLVGKTIEQAMMEVMEEEELDRLRDHQVKFEELRNAELIETQRLEEQARRRREEKDRRLHQQAEVAMAEREASKKIAARSFAQSYLSGLVPSVFKNLEDGGYFFDAQERTVESEFLPWLMDGVDDELAKFTRARALLDEILGQVIKAQAAARAVPSPEPVEEGEPADEDGPAAEAGAAEGTEAPGADGEGAEGEAEAEGEASGEANPEGNADGATAEPATEGDAGPPDDGDAPPTGDVEPAGGEGGSEGDETAQADEAAPPAPEETTEPPTEE